MLRNWGKAGTTSEGLKWYPTDFTRDVIPIPCHSHNDYWRKVALFSALRAGCIGTEADVWLLDEDLYVGHNTASLTRNRTFRALYVNPLVETLEKQNPDSDFYNGTNHGVFDTDPEQSLTLLVDVKTSGAETWQYVLDQLEPLRERGWLSYVQDGTLYKRPITVVGTGNTPFDVLTANSTYRDAFFDAPLDEMWEAPPPYGSAKKWPTWDDGSPGEDLVEGDGSAEEIAAHASAKSAPPLSPEPMPLSAQNAGKGKSGTTPSTQFNELNSYYASVSFGSSIGRMWGGRLSHRQMKLIRGQVRSAPEKIKG
jgi:hypothetical protein